MSTGCRMSVSSFSCRNRSSKSRKVSFAYCCVLILCTQMLHVYYTIGIVNRYSFLIETYSTERQKILGVWALFNDETSISKSWQCRRHFFHGSGDPILE